MTVTLPSEYQAFIHTSRYARWLPEQNRRETWNETVARYFDFFVPFLAEHHDFTVSKALRKELEDAILNLEVMPSMRCLMTAGPALERDHAAGYNCTYLPIDRPGSFDEILYLLMCGCGVGYSVESQYVNKLPTIADEFYKTDTTIVVADSRIGWAKALKELLAMLYAGQIPAWDMSNIRPAGARLITFGGRSSGPEPLDRMFKQLVGMFQRGAGRKLTTVECHDIVCMIADVVIVGGVRRSALISLSDLHDQALRHAKSGQWWAEHKYRALSNNSYVVKDPDGITLEQFMDEWKALYLSRSGERGIFSRIAAKKIASRNGRRDTDYEFGTNPCSEIILRPRGFCNLTEVVVREQDTTDDIKRKVRLAAILGTWQSCLTSFRYLSREWKKNAEDERLLGVSLTGIYDNAMMRGEVLPSLLQERLTTLKDEAIATNAWMAKKLKINPAAAITCVKPSGTISQLVDSASGIHPRYSKYYIRRVRMDRKDPLTQFMVEQKFPYEEVEGYEKDQVAFAFPIAAPNTITRHQVFAKDQLDLWLTYQMHWSEHKPSCTVYVREHEWLEVGAWVWKNLDWLSGVSFLPYSENDHMYSQAPYTEVTEAELEIAKSKMPKNVDWSQLSKFELEDTTTGTQELACSAGVCELVGLAVP